jgi:hypothetical protein
MPTKEMQSSLKDMELSWHKEEWIDEMIRRNIERSVQIMQSQLTDTTNQN